MINQLLWLACTDAGSSTAELASTDLTGLVENVVSEIKMLVSSKGQTVSISLPDAPIHADVDEAPFRRMLLILLDNAVKYAAEGGKLTIDFMEDAGQITIKITDMGAGIPAEQLPLIFDRFWRADNARPRDAGGTGLGLAIAREIAKSHGAEI